MHISDTIKKFFHLKIVKVSSVLILAFLGSIFVFALIFNFKCSSAQPNFETISDEIPTQFKAAEGEIKDYHRAEESTYLTFPEWYLVFNPQEYGQFIAKEKPSHFPYFTSIGQFWSGYCQVYGITKRNYPFNVGDHLMEAVIGTSFSVEYAVKGVWENTIGRVSEWLGGTQTEEDVYAAKVAQEYSNFIPIDPWYLFPFGQKLGGLWKDTSFFGPHILRKWERKTFLTLEYGVKAIYGWLIKIATHSIYGIADTEVYASVQDAPDNLFQNPRVHKIKDLGNHSFIITVPHSQGFTDTVPILARQGIKFVDFAGNGEILLTAVAPHDWNYDLKNGHLLFTMDMMTTTDKRIAVQAPVKSLSEILVQLESEGVKIEHLYDY